jgi:hypothetical protein
MNGVKFVWRCFAELNNPGARLYQAYYKSSPNVRAVGKLFKNVVFSVHLDGLPCLKPILPVFFIASGLEIECSKRDNGFVGPGEWLGRKLPVAERIPLQREQGAVESCGFTGVVGRLRLAEDNRRVF